MKLEQTISPLPLPVKRALLKLGRDISDARRRRRISTAIMAQRASISLMTLNRIEKGESGVALGSYAKALFSLGMVERVSDLADVRHDKIGLELEVENLPKRIRKPKK